MYQRTEYHRERDEDRDRNTGGGWRSWFGLDNKDKDDYHYSRTTTYRNDDRDRDNTWTNRDRDTYNRNYGGDRDTRDTYNRETTRTYVRDAPQYTASSTYNRDDNYGRGGYGYQTSGEYNRGYGYGGEQPYRGTSYGDRDNYRSSAYTTDRDTYPASRGYGDTCVRDSRDTYGRGGLGQTAGGYSYAAGRYSGDNANDYSYTQRSYGGDRGYTGDRDNSRYQQYSSRTNNW